jgi:hypothetical protein
MQQIIFTVIYSEAQIMCNKAKCKLVPVQTINTYGGDEVLLHLFLTWAHVGGELSTPRSGRLTRGRRSTGGCVRATSLWTFRRRQKSSASARKQVPVRLVCSQDTTATELSQLPITLCHTDNDLTVYLVL